MLIGGTVVIYDGPMHGGNTSLIYHVFGLGDLNQKTIDTAPSPKKGER